jgi:hypothetical protein
MRWRTEFAAPGTVLADEPWEKSFEWAVGQWKWVGEEGEEDDDTEQGEWVLRGKQPLTVSAALDQLPPALRTWVLESTRRAIGVLQDLVEEQPEFRLALDKLRAELAESEAGD